MSDKKAIKQFMLDNKQDFIDKCEELNYTKLAEDTAGEFNLYLADDSIPEWVYDLAVDVE